MSFKVGEKVRIVSGLLKGEIGAVCWEPTPSIETYTVSYGRHRDTYEYFEDELEHVEDETTVEDHKYLYTIKFVNGNESVGYERPVPNTEGVYVFDKDDPTAWIMVPWHRIASIIKDRVE